jgi:hypothetical protein
MSSVAHELPLDQPHRSAPPPEHPSLTPVSADHRPEPSVAVTEAVDETEMPLPSDPQTFFLGGLFALGILATLYVASSIILPVVLAFVLNLLLQPGVRLLERWRFPRAVGKRSADPLVRRVMEACESRLGSTRCRYGCRRQNGRPIGRLEGEPRQSA